MVTQEWESLVDAKELQKDFSFFFSYGTVRVLPLRLAEDEVDD